MYVKCFLTNIGGQLVIQIPHWNELKEGGAALKDLLETVESHSFGMADHDHYVFTQPTDAVTVFMSEWHWKERDAAEKEEQVSK
tara:strand:+ start:235 stop:486 length:252 start_codon:yes stop_codon:yes gene_type:complete